MKDETRRAPVPSSLSRREDTDREPLAVVGIGASAGGLEALSELLSALPAATGLSFVVALHLDPERLTALPELLGRASRIPVAWLEDGARLQRDRVYLVPPGRSPSFQDLEARLAPQESGRGRGGAVDRMLRSLAAAQGCASIGVLFSGAGRDGTVGLAEIRREGGLTLVQSPDTAVNPGMPSRAIAAGVVDRALPVADMPSALARYLDHLQELRARDLAAALEEEADRCLGPVCALVLERTGHDFASYKRGTLLRRIQRRLQVLQIGSLAAYLDHLAADEREARELLKEILIGVTSFFRDPEAFESLARNVLPELLERCAGDRLRAWVPGCATGEEAYSLAILLREAMDGMDRPPQAQVFATDIDSAALETARRGVWPARAAEGLSPERLERFFKPRGDEIAVAKSVREMLVVSEHDVLREPPFSRLQLISCRNLLIYLDDDLQRRLLSVFHYALEPGGHLFLGSAESAAGRQEEFAELDKRQRIYRRRETGRRLPVRFPALPAIKLPLGAASGPRSEAEPHRREPTSTIERLLVERFVPACAVIDPGNVVVHFSARTGQFLEPPPGPPTASLLRMARPSLRPDLRAAIHRARKHGVEAVRSGVRLELEEGARRVNLIVRPLAEEGPAEGHLLVVFQDAGPDEPRERGRAEGESGMLQELEAELTEAQERLRLTVEDLEDSNEQLKSSNEELLSMNQELQSANEELQTSKEEQQLFNEELETVNSELSRTVEDLDRANGDLHNLYESTRIAALFLDRELRIQSFTPAAGEVFPIRQSDVGRPLTDLAPPVAPDELQDEIAQVVRSLAPRERQISAGGRAWSMRILPYRTLADEIRGVVVTFVDVTELERAHVASARLAAIVESSQDAIIGKTLDGVITSWNAGAERMYGYSAQEAVGRSMELIVPPERSAELRAILERLRRRESVETMETERLTKDGRRLRVLVAISPILDRQGRLAGGSSIARDVTEKHRAEEALRESESRFRTLADAAPVLIWMADAEANLTYVNARWAEFRGRPLEEDLGRGWAGAVHPGDLERWLEVYRSAIERREPFQLDLRLRRADGQWRWMLSHGAPRLDEQGTLLGYIGSCVDIEDRKRAEEALREGERRLSFALHAGRMGAWEWDARSGEVSWSPGLEEIHGIAPGSFGGTFEDFQRDVHPEDCERVLAAIGRALEERGEYLVEYRIVRPDGEERWLEAHGRVSLDERGEASGMAGVCRDVTERARSERGLMESEARKGAILSAALDCIVTMDEQGRIVDFNPAAERTFGRSREDVVGHSLAEILIPPRMRAQHRAGLERYLATGEGPVLGRRVELEAMRADGSEFPVELAIVPLALEGARVIFSAHLRDITERVRSEQDLARRAEELARSNADLEQFAYVASHDLQEPLRIVSSYVTLLARRYRGRLDAQADDFIEYAIEGVGRMQELIEGLLTYSRVREEDEARHSTRADEALDTALENLRAALEEEGGALVRDPLPAVGVERTRLVQVFQNLVGNALKFRGEQAPRIHVSAEDRGTEWLFSVRDNGIGMEPAHLERIFLIFQRLHGRSRYPGAGVGLAICKRIVEQEGGRIWAESEPGAGSTFRFTLPKK